MHMSRDVFQILAMVILGTLVYIWFFFSESEKTIPIVVLISLFILLSLEYIREGFSKKKLDLSSKSQILSYSFFSNYARL